MDLLLPPIQMSDHGEMNHLDPYMTLQNKLWRQNTVSENLHTCALPACPEEDTDLTSNRKPLSFVERRRLLYVSKIAATVGKDIDYEVKVARIDADTRILKLQEEIVQHDPEYAQGKYKSKLLRPSELIEMCLKRG